MEVCSALLDSFNILILAESLNASANGSLVIVNQQMYARSRVESNTYQIKPAGHGLALSPSNGPCGCIGKDELDLRKEALGSPFLHDARPVLAGIAKSMNKDDSGSVFGRCRINGRGLSWGRHVDCELC